MTQQAFICEAVRSPVGKKGGSLSTTRADDLAAHVLNAVVERAGIDAEIVEDVQMGCVTQIGEQGWNIARSAVLAAGFPVSVCGASVNRMCGSSLQTTNSIASAIMAGQADVAIAAGVECMSRTLMGTDGGDLSPKIMERFDVVPQGLSAEMVAEKWNLTREQLDEYAWNSHQRALAAQAAGHFDAEIVAIDVTNAEGETVSFAKDETPRDSTIEKVASLPAVFKPDGVITAGNSSQICDGSAAILLAGEASVGKHGLKPRARVVSTAVAGVDPTMMLHGNPDAIRLALKRAGLGLDDMAVIEVNEAFASIPLQTVAELGLQDRMGDVNPVGGGISLGHPLGASGARILATMLGELERRNARYGIASMCIGFGQAIATVVERVD